MDLRNLSKSNFSDFNSILDALQDCDIIKYAAYRTAAKLRFLQRALYMDKLPLRIISNIFERHHLHQTENSLHLDGKELEPILHDMYFITKKEYYPELNVDHAIDLMTKYLFNVFDRKRKNTVQVLCCKIGLTVFCAAKPREKYQYFFNQLADHNSCLSKKKLEILLKKILHITEYISEEPYFSLDLIPGTVESCFQNNIGTLGISEDDFISWLVQDPQILVWLSTLYRIQLSEMVCHNAKCGVCRIYPVIGLRYRCLRCLCYNQCQSCFFTGKFNKKHKLTHPVQEYCFPVTSSQSTKAFLVTIKNRILKSNSKLQYLPAKKIPSDYVDPLGESTRLLDEIEVSSKTVINGSRISLQNQPQKELHSIILHLENESEKIIPQIEKLCAKSDLDKNECRSQLKKCLLNHKNQVEEQVRRLKLLKDHMILRPSVEKLLESTPVIENTHGKIAKNGVCREFEGISPITRLKYYDQRSMNEMNDQHEFLRRMMWDKYDIVNGTVNTSWEEFRNSPCGGNSQGSPVAFGGNAIKETNVSTKNEMDLSTWLGGSELEELDYSSERGFTCFLSDKNQGERHENTLNISDKRIEGLRLQNEKYLRDVEFDLEEILNKLQRLTSSDNSIDKENCSKGNESDEDVMADIDHLLVGLISGIDKLISN